MGPLSEDQRTVGNPGRHRAVADRNRTQVDGQWDEDERGEQHRNHADPDHDDVGHPVDRPALRWGLRSRHADWRTRSEPSRVRLNPSGGCTIGPRETRLTLRCERIGRLTHARLLAETGLRVPRHPVRLRVGHLSRRVRTRRSHLDGDPLPTRTEVTDTDQHHDQADQWVTDLGLIDRCRDVPHPRHGVLDLADRGVRRTRAIGRARRVALGDVDAVRTLRTLHLDHPVRHPHLALDLVEGADIADLHLLRHRRINHDDRSDRNARGHRRRSDDEALPSQ